MSKKQFRHNRRASAGSPYKNNQSGGRKTLAYILSAFLFLQHLLVIAPSGGSGVAQAAPISDGVVISQVYGGGGNASATYLNDFVELFNRGTTTVSVNNWSVQYTSAAGTGNFGSGITVLSGSIAPGQYYLVRLASGGTGGVALPAADANGTTNMATGAGKVALVNSTTGIACNGSTVPCTAAQLAAMVDLVGYGSTANVFEGAAPAPGPPNNTTAALRAGHGCTDTGVNSADFTVASVTPQNSASPLNPCSAPTPTPTPTATPTPTPTPTPTTTQTNPTATGLASPPSVETGQSTLLTVQVTPGANPTSTGIAVSANLTSIGGAASQAFADNGQNGDASANDNIFSYQASVPAATAPGAKSLAVTVADAQNRAASTGISLTVNQPAASTLVISQIYGGGGNSGAPYLNDFVEVFNNGTETVTFSNWSVQYASAAGTGWQAAPISGSLAPGQYYLVQLSGGTTSGVALPAPDASGGINMSGSTGKIALVKTATPLSGACPSSANIADFVGYGASPSCFEGAAPAPTLGNTTAAIRVRGGCRDTNFNGANFVEVGPVPRNSSTPLNPCPGGDPAPEVYNTTPTGGATSTPLEANVTINFDEDVATAAGWYQISCSLSGIHPASASASTGTVFTLNPDTDFQSGDVCTVTVFATGVTDIDTIDPPDNMAADYTFSFTMLTVRNPDVHLSLGNPSGATADPSNENNYLMKKAEYTLSYNKSKSTPNWTSWHLDSSWLGSAPRQDDFRNDTTLPAGWFQVQGNSYSGSGFDRGHMTPSADRTASIPENSATFLMTNMIPQAPGNNQGPWADLENDERVLLSNTQNEVYIISGGAGQGGTGTGGFKETIGGGLIAVPAATWKVILVMPKADGDDAARVTTQTRTIAVIMPNRDDIRPRDWKEFLVTVDDVEALTGYDFISQVPVPIQADIESRLDAGSNSAPVAASQAVPVTEDAQNVPVTLSATDANVNNTLTYEVVGSPEHGSLSGTGANLTYTPDADYFGTDSFTFKASDGTAASNTATVSITVSAVNDTPLAQNDSKTATEDTALVFAASALTANDAAGGEGENDGLTVTDVISTANTNGQVTLSNGQISYNPAANFNGAASFDYRVCDNGTTNGAPDPKCATATVNVQVGSVNDKPVLVVSSDVTIYAGGSLVAAASATDADLPADTLLFSLNGPAGASINPSTGAISWTPTLAQVGQVYTLTVRVTDAGMLMDEKSFRVAVAYEWSDLQAPLLTDGSSVFNKGRTVPVKFQLTGAAIGKTDAVVKLYLAPVNGETVGQEFAAASAGSSNQGNLFRYDEQEGIYIFNLNTKSLAAGVYRLRVDFGDGVMHSVLMTIR
jgi:endonuclease G